MRVPSTMSETVGEAFARRDRAGRALSTDVDLMVCACREMADRFRGGGKLIVFGNGGGGTDAAHVAVEFMHPVIVGKRALPAIALSNDAPTLSGLGADRGFEETFAHQLRQWAEPGDMAMGISRDGRCANVLRGLGAARELGLCTLALVGDQGEDNAHLADHVLIARSDDPAVIKEMHVTMYHVLWELVHVFLDSPGEWPG